MFQMSYLGGIGSALAHLLDRAHVIHIYNMFALLCIHSNYRFTVVIVGLAAIQI